MALNLHHLRILLAVADAGSISAAAAEIRISQPAVSKAISALERQLELPLLERHRRGVQLTEAGAALVARARVLFAVEREAEEELAARKGLHHGMVRIGASTTIATYMLPTVIAAFKPQYPGIDLRVVSANTRDVAELLLAREVDVALVEGPVRDRRLNSKPWREDELVVIAAPQHEILKRRRTGVRALANELFVVRESGSGTREVTERALRRSHVRLSRTMEVGSTEAIKQTVAAGLGLAIVSLSAAADQIALGTLRVVPVRGLTIRRALTRLVVSGRRPPPGAAAFERLLT